jgi:chromosome segregation ATPase
VRDQLTDVDRERRAIEARLLELRQADEELARLHEETAGFDPTLHQRIAELVAAEALIPDLAEAVAQASATARDRQRDANRCDGEVVAAEGSARELDEARSAYAQIDRVERELGEVAMATDELGTRALTTRHAADQLADDLETEEHGNALTRLRGRQQIRKLRNALETASQRADDIERRARAAEDLLARRRAAAAGQVSRLAATATASHADIAAADARLDAAQQAAAEATRVARQAEDDLGKNQQVLLAAEGGPRPTHAQRATVEDAERRQLPALAARLESVRSQIADAQPERAQLQDEYSRVQERFERLRQDAEGEIIRQARLVATTLARLRTSKSLMDGPYDVVLVDEAGAATLPEILLAVSRARRAAVLLGDFFQLGPVKCGGANQPT